MDAAPPYIDILFATGIEPWMLALVFGLSFAGSLLFVPWALVRLPADYFRHDKRQAPLWGSYHPVLRFLLRLLKNLLGLVLLLVGVAMLVLPGQGLLTILIGVLMLDFPGKYQGERWLVRRKPVRRAVTWLRTLRHKPPFELD